MTMILEHPADSQVNRGVVLRGVSWATYEAMLKDVGNGSTRLTYDCGRLEIMSPLPIHENVKSVLARLIETYSDAVGIQAECFGSTTFQREDLEKGLEPDECYYIQHAPQIIGNERFDLTIDPPPDLAIEVDIHPPEIAKQPIYGALGVPEIWRFNGREVVSLHRTASGLYEHKSYSLAFPIFSMTWVNELLVIGMKQGQSAAVAELRRRLKG